MLARYCPRPLVALDTETALMTRGRMAPPLACLALDEGRGRTELHDHESASRVLAPLLARARRNEITLCGHNIAYDVAVLAVEDAKLLPAFFDVYEVGAIHDTMIAEWLLDTAAGTLRTEPDEETGEYRPGKSYGLESLAKSYLGQPPYKDEWRLRYGELRDVPLSAWPERAKEYPQQDVDFTLRIALAQREADMHNALHGHLGHACRTYLALHLVSCWGRELDPHAVRVLTECMTRYSSSFVPDLEVAGIVLRTAKGRHAGKITRKKAVVERLVAEDLVARGVTRARSAEELLADPARFLPDESLTDGGKSGRRSVRVAREALLDCEALILRHLSAYLDAEKLRTSFGVPMLAFGRGPLHARYGWAETGRTTCSGGRAGARTGFNDQQLPRSQPQALAEMVRGAWGGPLDVRACCVPRPGHVYSTSDYSALEMRTWAQSCLTLVGESALAQALNEGLDPHALFACSLVGASYEEVVEGVKAGDVRMAAARQQSKVGNFGFPGGMGAKKFRSYAKGQRVQLSLDECQGMHALFRERWPEALPYFALAAREVGNGSATLIATSGMVRGGVGYSDWCNGHFQGLAADGATAALWRIVRECYDERCKSALFGSRVWAFVHDEFLAEHPEEGAHEAASRLADIARETVQEVVPDVKIEIEPALMRRWWKKAETVRDARGRLMPWEPV